nr:type II toxin-antitoxin system HicA family toxin [Candidatus Sigynarchaeum springense]
MKFPRDISGERLAKLLSKYDFKITRQTGSHIRLTSFLKGEYHITIPNHDPLKIGTFNNILSEIARYLEMDKQDLIKTLFG